MTLREALREWRTDVLPGVSRSAGDPRRPNKVSARFSWTCYVDHLHRNGLITDRQAQTWGQPPECQ